MNGTPMPPLNIAGELQAWLEEHTERLGFAPGFVRSASLAFRFKASRVWQNRLSLSIRCESEVKTPSKTFFGIYSLSEGREGWGRRKPEGRLGDTESDEIASPSGQGESNSQS